jgi:hypothetical protein
MAIKGQSNMQTYMFFPRTGGLANLDIKTAVIALMAKQKVPVIIVV